MRRADPILVSDHAIIRYIERVLGFDLTPIRGAIEVIASKAASGPGKHRILHGGHTYILDGRRVTTVLPKGLHKGNRQHLAANGKDARP